MIETDRGSGVTPYDLTTLPNGLQVLTASMPHTRSASVQVYLRVGARHEQPEVAGISHFVEHMVFKGTERRPNPVQISEAVEGVGGSMNAATDHEHTNYRALVPSQYMATALDVLADIVLHARFAPEDVERERAVIIEEISSTYDSPGEIVDLVFDELMWGDNPLGQDVAGTIESVSNITRDDLVEHVRRHYHPAATLVSVAGNVRHDEVVAEVERLWAGTEPQTLDVRETQPAEPEPGPRVGVYKKRTEQANLIVGVPALPYTHPDRHTQDVLDAILGGGMSSRLFVELRENRALAYAISSFTKPYADVGSFGVHAAVDNDRVAETLQGIMAELRRIAETEVEEGELRKVKEYIKGHTLLGVERSGYVAQWGGWQQTMTGHIETVDEVLDKIEAVTPADIQALARRLFATGKLHMALVGPFKKKHGLGEYLRIG